MVAAKTWCGLVPMPTGAPDMTARQIFAFLQIFQALTVDNTMLVGFMSSRSSSCSSSFTFQSSEFSSSSISNRLASWCEMISQLEEMKLPVDCPIALLWVAL